MYCSCLTSPCVIVAARFVVLAHGLHQQNEAIQAKERALSLSLLLPLASMSLACAKVDLHGHRKQWIEPHDLHSVRSM
jgi:hypothetical protein